MNRILAVPIVAPDETLVRVVAPHFVAGFVMQEDRCVAAAPILRRTVMGKSADVIRGLLTAKGWRASIVALSLLAACTPTQLADANRYHDQIVYVCKQAMAVAPMFPTVAPWLIGACQTEATIIKLALDPDSLGWLTGILGRL